VTLYYTHLAFLDHDTGPGHPERPDRLRAIEQALEAAEFATLDRREAPLGTTDLARLVHAADYVEALERARPREGLIGLDADTVMSPGSWEAALRGLGAATAAVDAVVGGEAANAFCAMRPPGHHAESGGGMGFCLFNNAAAAARHAQQAHGLARVAIVDFDVHHGNGTQEIFWDDPSVLYASTHQMPLYPGSGAASETGAGNIVNAPLRAGDGGPAFRAAMERTILPAVDAFSPALVIISAGFDAHERDPLGGLRLVEDDFAWATRRLMAVADRHAGGRVVSVLEGGYDLTGLAGSVAAHIRTLMGD
jgi:acetoin utilization deacetylase AcuC-like enzyme